MSDTDGGSGVNTDAGAAGPSTGSFSLGTGGLVAIIVVVVIVVIGGVSISVLWYLAKRRQWDLRASLRRASRRLTGRGPEPGYTKQRSTTRPTDRKSRRAGVEMSALRAQNGSKSQTQTKVREVRDVEKGLPPQKAPEPAPTMTGRSWIDRFHVATDDGR